MGRTRMIAISGLLLVAAVLAWRVWAFEHMAVAGPVTAQELRLAEHRTSRSMTLVPGASRLAAHRVWQRYHDRGAHQGVEPRLLGVSLVHVSSEGAGDPAGDYWLVFSDHVWQPRLGGESGPAGYYSREVVLVRASGRSLSGDTWLF